MDDLIHESRLAPHMEAYQAVENHVFRVKYRKLSEEETAVMTELKARAFFLYEYAEKHVKDGRYKSLGKTALEESIMWLVKEMTS